MTLLEGKNALITGGGRGIGEAVAVEFAKNGANVAVVARTKSELDETINKVEKFGIKGISIPSDLSSIEGVHNTVKDFFKVFSTCDILVNNAGISEFATVTEYPLEKAQKLFNVNIMASYAMSKLLLTNMIERDEGRILFTSSVQGNVFFSGKKVAYSASKAAITAMAKSLQAELNATNIGVSVILPGAIHTRMMRELMEKGQQLPEGNPPESIAPIYLFLASENAGRKYKGGVVNQQQLFQLLPKINDEVETDNFDMINVKKLMKEKLRKDMYKLFRDNIDLIEFLLRYKSTSSH